MSQQTSSTKEPPFSEWILGTGLRALVLAAIVLAGGAWASWDAARAEPGSGANIGLGLVIFAVEVVVAFVWGTIDGRRGLTLRWLAIRWAVVGVVTGCFASAYIQAGPGPVDVVVLLSESITVGLFQVALVAGAAAVIGGALPLAAARGAAQSGLLNTDHSPCTPLRRTSCT